jgi:predicted O-linked N-acetylglucosamine transferase (SPINDLY family)
MRKLAILSALAMMAVPAFATASSPTAKSDAQKQCRAERTAMGAQTFKDTYGTNGNKSNAFGKCVSHRTRQNASDEKTAHTNASKDCKAERAADPAAFKDKYGTNKNKSNAFGKCVSKNAKAQESAQQQP